MIKALYLYYYNLKGYNEGLFFTVGYLASMFALLLIGIFFGSEVLFDKGLVTIFLKGSISSSSYGSGRGVGKILGLLLIIGIGAILFVPSYFLYKNWVKEYDSMTNRDQNDIVEQGEKVMNGFAITVVIIAVGGVLMFAL